MDIKNKLQKVRELSASKSRYWLAHANLTILTSGNEQTIALRLTLSKSSVHIYRTFESLVAGVCVCVCVKVRQHFRYARHTHIHYNAFAAASVLKRNQINASAVLFLSSWNYVNNNCYSGIDDIVNFMAISLPNDATNECMPLHDHCRGAIGAEVVERL